jgi:polysaccharide deacetylase family protein (PEP-CTERM system associated)
MINDRYILMTVDVEDWFMVENFKPWIPFSSWSSYELRVERNTHKLLNIFDSIKLKGNSSGFKADNHEATDLKLSTPGNKLKNNEQRITSKEYDGAAKEKPPSFQASQPQAYNNKLSAVNQDLKCNGQLTTDNGHTKKVKATFFVLAWIAEKLPNLIREIHARGHEIASHGCNHKLSNQIAADALTKELDDSKKILEDIVGAAVHGFRAPSFSINEDTLKTVEASGYLYDSSYNSFSMHRRYGEVDLKQNKREGIGIKISNNFFELPISNLRMMKRIVPFGGGAYFRLAPLALFKLGVQHILKKDKAYLFYMHPWEIDPNQPRMNQISRFYKFRHYHNLDKTLLRLDNFLKRFSSCRFFTCYQYLQGMFTSGTSAEI